MTNDRKLQHFDGFGYDPDTGHFYGLTGRKVGVVGVAGYIELSVRVNGKRISTYGQRLAFYLMGVEMPPRVDHINGDRTDNRWCNLRPSDASLNAQNITRARSDNAVGLLGAQRCSRSGRFTSSIKANGRKHWLGSFDTAEEASRAYINAKREMHPHNTL